MPCLIHVSPALGKSVSPPPVPADGALLPPVVEPKTLKEGLVEKKGHSVAFLMWPELVILYYIATTYELLHVFIFKQA